MQRVESPSMLGRDNEDEMCDSGVETKPTLPVADRRKRVHLNISFEMAWSMYNNAASFDGHQQRGQSPLMKLGLSRRATILESSSLRQIE
jgi:hypothetical protein